MQPPQTDSAAASTRRLSLIIGALLVALVIGIGIAIVWALWYDKARLRMEGERVDGEITNYVRARDYKNDPLFHPVVEYQISSGEKQNFQDKSLKTWSEKIAKRWRGKTRSVFFDPENPSEVVVEAVPGLVSFWTVLALTGVIVLFLLIGLTVVVFFLNYSNKRPQASSVLYWVFSGLCMIALGSAAIYSVWNYWVEQRALLDGGVQTEGIIVAFTSTYSKGAGTSLYFPVVEYTDSNGEMYQSGIDEAKAHSEEEARRYLGDAQTVIYHPNFHGDTITNSPNMALGARMFFPGLIGLVGVFFVPLGLVVIVVFVYAYRKG